jgi:hypothetical protein
MQVVKKEGHAKLCEHTFTFEFMNETFDIGWFIPDPTKDLESHDFIEGWFKNDELWLIKIQGKTFVKNRKIE